MNRILPQELEWHVQIQPQVLPNGRPVSGTPVSFCSTCFTHDAQNVRHTARAGEGWPAAAALPRRAEHVPWNSGSWHMRCCRDQLLCSSSRGKERPPGPTGLTDDRRRRASSHLSAVHHLICPAPPKYTWCCVVAPSVYVVALPTHSTPGTAPGAAPSASAGCSPAAEAAWRWADRRGRRRPVWPVRRPRG
jgi:hypothetical protein